MILSVTTLLLIFCYLASAINDIFSFGIAKAFSFTMFKCTKMGTLNESLTLNITKKN